MRRSFLSAFSGRLHKLADISFAAAGKKLADLHMNYESAKEFPLKRQENIRPGRILNIKRWRGLD